MNWNYEPPPAEAIVRLARGLGVSNTLAELLLKVDPQHVDEEQARFFLDPKLAHLDDPFVMEGMKAAVDRVVLALERAESILIFGDYDVDGVTSTVSLVHLLRRFGANPQYLVPRRLDEGYGLSVSAINRAIEAYGRPDLFIALDCGTNARREVDYLNELGVSVVIVDHHQAKADHRPEQAILLNPHVFHTEDKPERTWLHLCTAGLVFKLIHALVKTRRETKDPVALDIRVADYLDLAAMGTVADLVPLRGENRLITRQGIRSLERSRRPGIHALFEASGIQPGETLEASDIGFRIGPRINASGRLADAREPINLLLNEHYGGCQEAAKALNELNSERQEIERQVFEEARAQLGDGERGTLPAGLVVYGPDWHHGVAGIVASRLVQEYYRPVLVIGRAEPDSGAEPGLAKGSGRSVAGVNLVEMLEPCKSLLAKWGGHPMAIGLSIDPAHIGELRDRFAQSIGEAFPSGLPERTVQMSAWIRPNQIAVKFMDDLDRLRPFGMGNPKPIFGIRGAELLPSIKIMKGVHFRFQLAAGNGIVLSGVAWRMADRLPPVNTPIDLAVRVGWNVWNGNRTIQLEMVDWKPGS